jgi:hypothetical protein
MTALDPSAAEIRRLLDVLALAVPPKSAAFVSGPLASGRRRYERLDAREVRAGNAREMEAFAAALRTRLGRPVISPARFEVPTWRGRTYGEFFRAVIERFAREVWFMDGWELSSGSVGELATCTRLQLPRLDAAGNAIDHRTALRRCRRALEVAARSGVDHASLRDAVEKLERSLGVVGHRSRPPERPWNA